MKKIIFLLSFFYIQHCYAQEKEIDFINEVTQIGYTLSGIDTLPGYHYLVESPIKIDTKSVIAGMEYMEKNIPKRVKQELLKKIAIDTLTVKWNCKNLIKTRCIKDSSSARESTPYYFFSKPIFDGSGTYALMQVNRGYTKSPIGGYAILIFNKKNGKWHFLENIADSEC